MLSHGTLEWAAANGWWVVLLIASIGIVALVVRTLDGVRRPYRQRE